MQTAESNAEEYEKMKGIFVGRNVESAEAYVAF